MAAEGDLRVRLGVPLSPGKHLHPIQAIQMNLCLLTLSWGLNKCILFKMLSRLLIKY